MTASLRSVLLVWSGLLVALRLWAQPLSAQPVVVLPTDQDRVPLRGTVASFADSSFTRSITDILTLSADVFKPVTAPVPNFGYNSNQQQTLPVWLRFRLQNPANQPQAWLSETNFWCYDTLQLFVVDAGNQLLSASPVQGWRQPTSQRLLHHRYFWFPVTVPPRQAVTVYIRMLKTRGTQILPVELIRASAYESLVQRGYLFWGGTFFTLFFVLAISLFLFLTTFDRVYWKYLLCLVGLTGYFFINDGFLYQYAFEAQFWLPRQNIYFLFPLGLFYSQLLFVRTFLPLQFTPSHRWHAVSTVVLWCGVFSLFSLIIERFVPFAPTVESVLMLLFSIFYWFPMPVIVAYIVISIRRRYQPSEGWLYFVAVAPFYTLFFGQVLANFRLIPTYEPTADFIYYGLAALFEVLVLTFGLAYRYKMDRDQTERLISDRNEQQQRAYETEMKALAMTNSLLLEKERISRDLHDNVGAHLAFVVTNLTHISDQAEKQPVTNGRQWADQLRSIVNHTREAVKLLRETIWATHQESFTVEEFAERLNQYINRYIQETNGLYVDVVVTGAQTQRLTSMQVLNLFRIVQEALNNVIKHAQASQASVQLQVRAGGRLKLRVQDNGRGFTWLNGAVSDQHYGLKNMETRAQELGGSFRVFAESPGTVVEVEVG